MIRSALFVLALARGALAQQAGTLSPTESHPKLAIQQCSSAGCETLARSIVLDANWRWFDEAGANCFDGYAWAPVCDGDPTCTRVCALEGGNYEGTYGIKAAGHNLTIGFVTRGGSGNNVGSRSYLLGEDDATYEMFTLNNREFTFDVDVSSLPCGLNAALYFVEMPADGGLAAAADNAAGAAFGTGYCDAQCPHDVKYIEGEANSLDWVTTPHSGKGRYGACCAEMDLWEANAVSSALTPHPCAHEGLLRCEGAACGDADLRYNGTCDKDGCDFNPFRLGEPEFYGASADFGVDSSRPFTVVTQFVTDDGTDDGALVEIRRKYVQDGRVIANPTVSLPGDAGGTFDSVSDAFCAAQKQAFTGVDDFKAKGGLGAMGAAHARGMVLVLSLWDDWESNMLWLDSTYPTDANASVPGAVRGSCPKDSGDPTALEASYPDAFVTFANIRTGAHDTTYGDGYTIDDDAIAADDAAAGGDDAAPDCVGDYAQCGGTSWDGVVYGPFDCCTGAPCVHSSASYWQCVP